MAKNNIEETFTHRFANEKFKAEDKWIEDNLLYEIIAGSRAYGVEDKDSDYDIVSIFMDRHQDLYPQNYGYVLGFDDIFHKSFGRVDNVEVKGVNNRILHKGIEVEGEWRSLTKFFNLACFKGSPNIVESLFVRSQCVKYIHPAFGPIRDNAPKLLSMKSLMAFKGYMHGQFHKINQDVKRGVTENGKRQWMLDEYGYDVKKAYHILRLMDLLDQMMSGETALDLMRNKDECKRMRQGQLYSWEDFQRTTQEKFDIIEKQVKSGNIKLPQKPRTGELRNILNSSIEEWYGTPEGQTVHNKQYISTEDIYEQLKRIETGVDNLNPNINYGLGAG